LNNVHTEAHEPKSVCFLITAFNEEEHLAASVETVRSVGEALCLNYQIVIVNDGSTDATGRVASRLAGCYPQIVLVNNERNLGLGGAYKEGLKAVNRDYVMWITGDNSETKDNIERILCKVGEADIVVPVLIQDRKRPWFRRVASNCFTFIVNTLFGFKLGYYNGTVVHKTALITSVDLQTSSFAYQAEALVKLMSRGHTYTEVEYRSARYDGMFSNAMRPKNLIGVMQALCRLKRDVLRGHF
jgi:glycosyltransferase involved in cell wall biosynthesis